VTPAGEVETEPASTAAVVPGNRGAVVAAETGTLTLVTTPPVTVRLGGELLGRTPLRHVVVPAGQHRLALEVPGRAGAVEYDVAVQPGERVVRRIDLRGR